MLGKICVENWSVLVHEHVFHSFKWLCDIPLWYMILTDGHLCCCYFSYYQKYYSDLPLYLKDKHLEREITGSKGMFKETEPIYAPTASI